MFELRDVYKTYAENYAELRGRAPTARALAYCEKVVDHAEKMYLTGKRDAENGEKLPDDITKGLGTTFPDDLAGELSVIMKQAYFDGWKDGGGK